MGLKLVKNLSKLVQDGLKIGAKDLTENHGKLPEFKTGLKFKPNVLGDSLGPF